MRARRSALRFASVAALAASLALAPSPARSEGSGAPRERPDDAVTLTVRGGVSLGAYEAGLTWGIVRFLKTARASGRNELFLRPRLAAVSGASAGAVNAFLAAALWCQRLDRDRGVDDNLLLEAWRALDLDGFLPRAAGGYAESDGLLAAAPLDRTGRQLGEALFGPGAAERFVPGCRVPVGLTVTPFEPIQVAALAGLTATTQRLVVPWLLEVGAGGAVTIRRQPLPKGELAESVLELAGIPLPGEAAPSFRPEVVVQALLASAAVPMAFAPRRLCSPPPPDAAERTGSAESCADYVDGGVFDNAPMGLTVALVEGAGGGTVLHPITSFLLDPERRRLAPPAAQAAPSDAGHPTLGRQLRLFGSLLSTARGAELARTIRSRGWNRTTQRLLRDFSTAAAEVAELHATVAHLAASARPAGAAVAPREAATVDRAAFGRALSACLERLAEDVAGGAASPHRCALDVPALGLATPAPGDEQLPPGEVVRVAERLARLLRVAHQADGAVPGAAAAAVARQRALETGTSLVATTLLLLADEVGRVAASGLPEADLRRFRDAVLEPVRRSSGFPRATNLLLAGLLDAELGRLERVAPPPVAAEARRARDRLAALPPGALFGLDLLSGAATASSDALAHGAWTAGASAAAWGRLLTLVEARTRLAEISTRVAALRQQADELGDGTTEYQLAVSSRFAPLAGSQLSGFAGFLDEPLRLHDYYVGLYEAAHSIAVAVCTSDPPQGGDAVPARLPHDPSELDLSATSTQRCVGGAMREAVEVLGIRGSPRGRQVVATLAGLELAASLGRSSRALVLRQEPSWSWLDELAAPREGDPVLATLAALTEDKVPCRPGDDEPLCLRELTFDAFLAALRAHGYRPTSAGLALALRDAPLFWADTSERLAARALAVERRAVRSDPGPLSRTVIAALSAGQLLAARAAERGPAPRVLLDPSSIPGGPVEGQAGWRRIAAHAVPYRLSLDVSRGGFGLAWLEPELAARRWLTLRSTLEPVGYRSGHGWSSAAGALLVGHAGAFSLGAGPRWWLDWRGGAGLGVEARAYALQDRFAIAVGMRDPGAATRGWFVTLSVSDLNGLAYWLSPLGAR